MKKARSYVIDGKAIQVAKRQWFVNESWMDYFPMDEKGTVTFSAPWKAPSLIVESKESALELIRHLKRAIPFCFLLLLVLSLLVWVALWNTPFYFLGQLMAAWLAQYLTRKCYLPLVCRPLYEKGSMESAELVDRRINGTQRLPMAEGRCFFTLLFSGLSWASAWYWWEYRMGVFYGVAACSAVAMLASFYCFSYFLRRKTTLPSVIFQGGAYMVMFTVWVIFSFFAQKPDSPRELGSWGRKSQSPPSLMLGFVQNVLSPVNWDRKIMWAEYRAKGPDFEWAQYSLNKEVFADVLASLQASEHVDMGELRSFDDQKTWLKYNKSCQRMHYPEWWLPGEGSVRVQFRILKKEEEKGGEKDYLDGWKKTYPGNFPEEWMKGEFIYDSEASKLYFQLREEELSPLEKMFR